MCTGNVTSDERVVKASSNGSRMRRKTWIGRSPIAFSMTQKITISMARPTYISPINFARPSTAARPWVANRNAMIARMASGESAMIHCVRRNIAAMIASRKSTTGLACGPTPASATPNSTENTRVGSNFCAAITAMILDGIRSSRNFTQSIETARLGGILPVGTRPIPTPG